MPVTREAEATERTTVAPGPELVGRHPEREGLAAACREAARGAGSLTVVSGRAGSGKSRLLEAAAEAAAAEGLTVVSTCCWPDAGAPPLWPWPSIVRDLCDEPTAADRLDDLAAGLAGAPRNGLRAGAEPTLAESDRFACFAAVTEHLAAATAERPACVIIDDLHAADMGALVLLRFLVRAPVRPRLAIVVSRRTGRPPVGSREARLLDEVEAVATPVVLRPLDGAETASFLRAHGLEAEGRDGGGGAGGLLDAVVQVSRGNPAALRRLALSSTDLADGVRRFVRGSLASLSENSRTVVQTAAVLGSAPPVAEVAVVAHRERGQVLAAVTEAARVGLVRCDRPGRFDFGHELVRSVLADRLPTNERLDVHARAAALAASTPARSPAGDDEPSLSAAQLVRWAHHALAAAPRSSADARSAIAACRLAARALAADRAHEHAEELLSAAVELYDHDSRGLGPPAASLLVEWAQSALRRGFLTEARSRFERAVPAARHEGDQLSLVEAVLGAGGQWLNEVRTQLERARVLGRMRDVRSGLAERDETAGLRLRLEARLAAEAVYDGEPIEPVLAVVDRARQHDDRRVLAEALSLGLNSLLAPHHADRRAALADEQIGVAAGVDGLLGLIGLRWRAVDLFLLGDVGARRALNVLREQAAALDNRSLLHTVAVLDVMLLLRAGRLDEAEAAAQRAHHAGQSVGEVDAFNYLGVHLLVIRWLQDRHGEMAEAIDAMVRSSELAVGEFAFRASAAVAAGRAGRHDRARAELDSQAADGLGALPWSSTWMIGLTSIVELAVLLGDVPVAQWAYDLLEPYADRPVMATVAVACLGSTERWLGLAAQVWGDTDLACRHLQRAVQANLALDNRPMVAMTRADLAGALLARGRPTDAALATDLLEQAASAAETMGMSRRAVTWRDLLTATPIATPVPSPSTLPELPAADPPRSPEPPPEPPQPRQGRVQRRGRGWLIALDGRRVGLPDLVGMVYMAELLRNPSRRISALALIGGPAEVPAALHHGDHHDLLDDQAKAAYADRLVDLTAELDEAEADADLGRAERLRIEIDALVEQLEAATGLGGRSRSFAHSPERARTAVRKAITRTLDRIDSADAVVGTALRMVIATGTTCSYEPTADPATIWSVDLC
jgi:tetratricopeptide (TPR) repeat protein